MTASRRRRITTLALTLTFALSAGACALPENRPGETTTTVAEGDAAAAKVDDRGFKVSDTASNGTLSLGATVAALQTDGASGSLELTAPAPSMGRTGSGSASSIDTASFFDNPAVLQVRPGVANAVLTGTSTVDPDEVLAIPLTVTAPFMEGRGERATFEVTVTDTGEIDRDLARLAGVTLDAKGRTRLGELTDGTLTLTGATLYLDAAGTKNIGGCAIVPNTSCVDADLFRSDLVRVDLTGANLTGVNLSMSTLRGSTLDRANVSGAQLFRSDLSDTSWVEADMRGANMHQLTLVDADMSGVRAAGANLFRSELDRTTLIGADFTYAALQQATITDANLTDATMTASNLFRAEMSGANLTNTRLADSNLAQTIAHGARFTNADLSHTDFTLADLRNADLSGADLSYSNLAGANLTGANLTGANLTGAVLWLTDLWAANLSGVRWADTTCPDGVITGTNRGTAKRPQIQHVCGPIFIPSADKAREVGPRAEMRTRAADTIGPRAGVDSGYDPVTGTAR